jgi:hypothetical protein
MAIQNFPAKDLITSAETRLADAERNLASCAASLDAHAKSHGGVPNADVIALSQAQAAVAQAYAALALAKVGLAMLGPTTACDEAVEAVEA